MLQRWQNEGAIAGEVWRRQTASAPGALIARVQIDTFWKVCCSQMSCAGPSDRLKCASFLSRVQAGGGPVGSYAACCSLAPGL